MTGNVSPLSNLGLEAVLCIWKFILEFLNLPECLVQSKHSVKIKQMEEWWGARPMHGVITEALCPFLCFAELTFMMGPSAAFAPY